ncbi:AraC family transcriptional regulator [Shimia aestuarii]|uniref:Transcriptional regulator, AraC family n=1 Tax=Shimia aestuarii TaxID=254406 RepID=A0A1I4MVI3_9RHOB|nr:AraC family transcriptional regulator [Shimia aestuarii]SFM07208.1 transcriptional regulator, AraC family [Shimia aestuarii]
MQSYEDRLMRVLRYIHDNPAEDLSLDRLADVAALSRFHWHRVFHAMTGETCAQAVRRVRLHRAANLLLESDMALDHIASTVGYDNLRSFSRAFRAEYTLSPSSFRKNGGPLTPLLTRTRKAPAMHPVTIRTDPPRTLVGLPHTGAYNQIGRSFDAFSALAQSRNLWPQLGHMIGMYHDDPSITPEADLPSFAGAEWRGEESPQGLEQRHLPGGRVAVMTFKGPYAELPKAYDMFYGTWLPHSGELPADDPCYEISLNSPMTTPPRDLMTEICLPLREPEQ